jgi:KaiC/GvpD/RAD55 family RecA-like ATPase
MADIVSFGIPELDTLLGGGLTVGSTNYLEVERGVLELSFVGAFLNEGLRQRNFCGITLYDLPPDVLIDRLTETGVNVQDAIDSGSLIIADLYEEGEYDPEGRGPILKTSNLNDPNVTLRLYLDLMEHGRKRVQSGKFTGFRIAAYSASTLGMSMKYDASYKLARAARMQIRQNKVTNLTTFNPKMFDETIVAGIEETCDSIISLAVKQVQGKYQRYIRVKQSPISSFKMEEVPYDIINGKPSIKPTQIL